MRDIVKALAIRPAAEDARGKNYMVRSVLLYGLRTTQQEFYLSLIDVLLGCLGDRFFAYIDTDYTKIRKI